MVRFRGILGVFLLGLLAFAIGLPTQVRAQSTISGYVTGTVTDASKGAVSNAKVVLENEATSFRQTGASSSDGVFHLTTYHRATTW